MAGDRIQLNLQARPSSLGDRVQLNLGVSGGGGTDPPVEPGIVGLWAGAGIAWAQGARVGISHVVAWGASPVLRVTHATRWAQSPQTFRALSLAWAQLPQTAAVTAAAWAQSLTAGSALGVPWAQLPTVTASGRAGWAQWPSIATALAVAWAQWPVQTAGTRARWDAWRAIRGARLVSAWRNGAEVQRRTQIPWGSGVLPPWRTRPPAPPEPPAPPNLRRGNRVSLNLGCPRLVRGDRIALNLGVVACYGVRPARRTYVINNTLSVVRLPDRTPIAAAAVSITGNVASYAWDLQMALADHTHEALLAPTGAGPAQVEVTVNGTAWVFVVESRSRSRQHLDGQGLVVEVSIAGRSPAALLAAPYAPLRSKVSTADRTAHQLADDEVENTGFTVDYGAIDWVVPAGALYYESTSPIDAVIRIAQASGGVVLSHPSQQVLQVRPRYPASPWDWLTTPPDVTISDDIMFAESDSLRSRPLYKAVVVTGELAGKGVTVRAVRDGEAATLYADQVTDPLINTVPVGRERARNALSDRGEQSEISVVLPIFPAPAAGQPGPILPLQLVHVLSAGADWPGLATALAISARWEASGQTGALVVDQTVTLSRHYTDAN